MAWALVLHCPRSGQRSKPGGRQRNIDVVAHRIQAGLRTRHLTAPEPVADAYGTIAASLVKIIAETNRQIADLDTALDDRFRKHPDAGIYLSMPGLGAVLGARALGEFGDDPDRYTSAKSRRNYAGTSPITVASGRKTCTWHLAPGTTWHPAPGTRHPAPGTRHPTPDTRHPTPDSCTGASTTVQSLTQGALEPVEHLADLACSSLDRLDLFLFCDSETLR